jgi:hypothetical protein
VFRRRQEVVPHQRKAQKESLDQPVRHRSGESNYLKSEPRESDLLRLNVGLDFKVFVDITRSNKVNSLFTSR